MVTREIRCVNPQCGTVNRVPRYWIRQVPECGKCRTKLPEPDSIRLLRRIVTIPAGVWFGTFALGGWYGLSQLPTPPPLLTFTTPTSAPTTSYTPIPKDIVWPDTRRSGLPPLPPPAPPIEPDCTRYPTPDHGIYRTAKRPDDLARLTIRTSRGASYFIKLDDASTGMPAMLFF